MNWAPVITVVIAVATFLVGAVRLSREAASGTVERQSTLLADMQVLNNELTAALARTRAERDELQARLDESNEQ